MNSLLPKRVWHAASFSEARVALRVRAIAGFYCSALMEAILARLAQDHWPLTLSVGAVNAPGGDRSDVDDLLRKADELMDSAKLAGKNKIATSEVA